MKGEQVHALTTAPALLRIPKLAGPPKELKETTQTAETRTGIKSIVTYEDPPP